MAEPKKEVRQSFLNKARSDKFRVSVPLPIILRNKDTRIIRSADFVDKDSINFSIYAINIPTIAVESVDVKFGGQTPRTSSFTRAPFEPVEVKYVVDNWYSNYWLLYTWLNLIHDEKTGLVNVERLSSQSLDDYSSDIRVSGIDEYNNNKIEYVFTSCVPTELGAINYNYQETNEVESTFKFRFHQLQIKIL
jgi:hypothetical protein